MTVAVNPHTGEVAIPFDNELGMVVGCLGARAWAWVAAETGTEVPAAYARFQRAAVIAQAAIDAGETPDMSGVGFPMAFTAACLWAAMEHERRKRRGPLPEYTIDDGYAAIDHMGSLEAAQERVVMLITLSAPFRAQVEALDRAVIDAGQESMLDPLRAAASGIGTPTLPQPSTPASDSTTAGS
jgi:hypothetical protein